MKITMKTRAALVALAILTAVPALAANDATARDLADVIALNGHACAQVVSVERRGDNDYVASCADGTRYRVVLRDGRVVVTKQ